jgi:ribosomal protein S18 acetylase RimI-like enzyme
MLAAEVSVRRATPEDIPTLVVLMEAFYAEADYGLDNEWASAAFRKLLSNPSLGCVWLAHTAESAIGHAVLTARYTMEHGASGGYVDDLYVEPDHRRQGIGFALLESLFHECRVRELASVYVEVGQSNCAALALYAKFGLVPVSDGRILLSGPLRERGTLYLPKEGS